MWASQSTYVVLSLKPGMICLNWIENKKDLSFRPACSIASVRQVSKCLQYRDHKSS